MTGGEAAIRLLERLGIQDVAVIEAVGPGGPSYHSLPREIRLPPSYYGEKYFLPVVCAAHEVGHAVQADRFPILQKWSLHRFRFFGGLAITSGVMLIAGVLGERSSLVGQGVLYYSLLLLVSVLLWAEEIDASRRGIRLLVEAGLINPAERWKGWAILGFAFGSYLSLSLVPVAFLGLMIILY